MRTIEWIDDRVRLIDQRLLPWELRTIEVASPAHMVSLIKDMAIRGAPAIGVAGGFGLVLAVNSVEKFGEGTEEYLRSEAETLISARPTAVNLTWAVDRVLNAAIASIVNGPEEMRAAALKEALAIADEDVRINKKIGEFGAGLISEGDVILHHCNTGSLATVEWGTALGVIRTAYRQGKEIHVLLDETRPRLQGARLSAWELKQEGISFEIITDSAAGYFMQRGEVNIVLVGSDRTASNGDVVNKIGTYALAVLAQENGIPFYPAVPTSTIDMSMISGKDIPIEMRSGSELRKFETLTIIPEDYPVRNPAFDITPHRYVTGIITENGIVYPPFRISLASVTGNERGD